MVALEAPACTMHLKMRAGGGQHEPAHSKTLSVVSKLQCAIESETADAWTNCQTCPGGKAVSNVAIKWLVEDTFRPDQWAAVEMLGQAHRK